MKLSLPRLLSLLADYLRLYVTMISSFATSSLDPRYPDVDKRPIKESRRLRAFVGNVINLSCFGVTANGEVFTFLETLNLLLVIR